MKKWMDDTNKTIMKSLTEGRKSYSVVSDEMGITENTVRSRVMKLMEDGVFNISGLVNPNGIPGLQVLFMGVKLKTLNLDVKAEEFCSLRGVISAAVVTGRYDLIVQVVISESDGFSLLDFFKDEVVKIDDISDIETFVVYQSHNLWVPYIV